ncbi:HIT family protein [Romboutsia maritimum]|uniref:HIT family protein n=1 Tax=Romboutsia maritimum TaxID=2020948 RepID=A0A371IUY5_9FIRM|nr:HIT family protein [Romboutsia maritimum]RDY24300.1 HIT family protein [Romboutsia maritimum]
MSCIFCDMKDYVLENELAFAIFDKFPVNKGHMLFIPKKHVKDFFDITKEEREAMFNLIDEGKKLLDEKYLPDGYNVGVNCGEVSGQTVMHVHVHLIPRYTGDLKNPKGGVRGVIPKKMKY